eukprot:UN11035
MVCLMYLSSNGYRILPLQTHHMYHQSLIFCVTGTNITMILLHPSGCFYYVLS